MATARNTRPAPAPRKPQPARPAGKSAAPAARRRANTRLIYDIVGIALIAIGLILLATLIWPPSEAGGENVFGEALARGLRLVVGSGAWVFPAVLVVTGFMLAVGKSRSWDNIGGIVGGYLVFLAWWQLWTGPSVPVVRWSDQFTPDAVSAYGGVIGAFLSFCLRTAVGTIGAHIVLAALSIVAFLWITDIPLPALYGPIERLIGTGMQNGGRVVADGARSARERAAERRAARAAMVGCHGDDRPPRGAARSPPAVHATDAGAGGRRGAGGTRGPGVLPGRAEGR